MNIYLVFTLLFVIVALAFYVHYQRQIYREAVKERFICAYCGHSFSNDQLERVGKYDYCSQHGMRRQKELNV